MIKILAACGAGVNSSHQIANAITEEMKKRGYRDIKVDALMVKDVNKEVLSKYDLYTPISKTETFGVDIPIVEAGPILYRVPAMAKPVFDKIEAEIKKMG
ncbi:PTS fructose transporter subunit IIB [Ignavigranum ruoffiae]|uniref:PTS fructose transporter subunit IIB n=1 Tax=Ignavigranum ruoffiae TaxID=89093 RepID=UPI003AFF6203